MKMCFQFREILRVLMGYQKESAEKCRQGRAEVRDKPAVLNEYNRVKSRTLAKEPHPERDV